jgi:hypothetical protein
LILFSASRDSATKQSGWSGNAQSSIIGVQESFDGGKLSSLLCLALMMTVIKDDRKLQSALAML